MRIWPSQSTVIKRKVGSTVVVDDSQTHSVAFGNRPPIVHPGAAQRVNAKLEIRAADDIHVEDASKVAYVCIHVVVPVCCGCRQSLFVGNALQPPKFRSRETRLPSPRSRR